VLDRPLSDIWKGSEQLQELRRLRFGDLDGCAQCPDNRFCNYCLAQSLKDTGNMLSHSESLCRQARLRAKAWALKNE